MKTEVMRFENVSMKRNGNRVLHNLNFYLLQGEVMSFLPLQNRGRDELLQLIQQNLPLSYGKVYFNGNLVNSYASSDLSFNEVSLIQETSGLIPSLSIVDNLFIMRPTFKKFVINEHVLTQQAVRFFGELGLSFSFHGSIDEIRPCERVIIEIARAVLSGHHLIILDHLSNFISQLELMEIFSLIRQLKKSGLSFLYVCNHHEEGFQISDRAILFSDGEICKILEDGELTEAHIAPHIIRSVPSNTITPTENIDHILQFEQLTYKHIQGLSFHLRESECVVLLDTDNTILSEMLELFTGNGKAQQGHILYNHKPFTRREAKRFLDHRIAIIPNNPTRSFLFYENNYMENLAFLLDRKIHKQTIPKEYIESVRREYTAILGDCVQEENLHTLSMLDLYSLVYHRVMFYSPKLVILIQPLANGDMYCRQHIIQLLRQIKEMGISILILASSISDYQAVSDRLIIIQNGRAMTKQGSP